MPWIALTFLSLVRILQTNALSLGATNKTCGHMTPIHGRYLPQSRDSIFSIAVATDEYGPGDQINVTLTGNCGVPFKGFILQARRVDAVESNDTIPIGYFNTPPGSHGVEGCGETVGGQAVTQDGVDLKTRMQFVWTAPPRPSGHVTMVATFVQDFATFWVMVRSPVIRDKNDSKLVNMTDLGPDRIQTTCPNITLPKCSNRNHCMGSCTEDSCSTQVTWLLQPESADFVFTLQTVVSPEQNVWMAIGFSTDKLMGNDSVVECVAFGGQVRLYSSVNRIHDKDNDRLNSTERGTSPGDFNASLTDGIFSCSFTLRTGSKSLSPDLTSPLYILFAQGETEINNDSKQQHVQKPIVSNNKVAFDQKIESQQTPTPSSSGDVRTNCVEFYSWNLLIWLISMYTVRF